LKELYNFLLDNFPVIDFVSICSDSITLGESIYFGFDGREYIIEPCYEHYIIKKENGTKNWKVLKDKKHLKVMLRRDKYIRKEMRSLKLDRILKDV
jgi:hypothetical protein